jgi:hypothetical protein
VVSDVVSYERPFDGGVETAGGLAGKPSLYRCLQKQTLNITLTG